MPETRPRTPGPPPPSPSFTSHQLREARAEAASLAAKNERLTAALTAARADLAEGPRERRAGEGGEQLDRIEEVRLPRAVGPGDAGEGPEVDDDVPQVLEARHLEAREHGSLPSPSTSVSRSRLSDRSSRGRAPPALSGPERRTTAGGSAPRLSSARTRPSAIVAPSAPALPATSRHR